MRNADIAKASVRFPVAQRRQMRAPVEQVVNLHQVDAFRAESGEGLEHLPDAALPSAGPDLGREERCLALAERFQEVADHRFRTAVHRRTVDHAAAGLEQQAQDILEWRPLFGVRSYVEGPPGRSEEHTSELQSLMRISYAVFCLKK